MYTDDSHSSGLAPALVSYIDELSVDSHHHGSPHSSTSHPSPPHQHQPQQPTQVNEPALTNHKRPFDLQRYPVPVHAQLPVAVTSPPPYWPVGVMMSQLTPSDDYNYQHHHRHHRHQQQELCHDDVTDDVTSPMYVEKIISELVETERTYVFELQQIVQVLYISLPVLINILVLASVCI